MPHKNSNMTITRPLLLLFALTTALFNAKLMASADLSAMLTTTDDENAKNAFHFNGTTILRILQHVNYLTIYLSDVRDCGNNLVRFLIEQRSCAVQIFFRSLANGLDRVNILSALNLKFHIVQRHRAVFVRAANELSGILRQFATKSGSLICIISDDIDLADLKQSAKLMWQEHGVFRVFYFLHNSSWFFNPFSVEVAAIGSIDDYGALIDANTWKSSLQIFANMHGYILRTYIFDSVYSSVFGNATTKQITSVRGADSEAAKLLSHKMNFTMEFQWPDDEFFGARMPNGSYNGAIGRLLRSETDVVMSGFFLKDYLTKDITFTVSVYMDQLCCYVMKARRIPQSILPLFAVRLDIWFGFFFVGLLSPLIWMLIRYLNLNFITINECLRHSTNADDRFAWKLIYRPKHQYARIFIDAWVIWVRVNIIRFPPFYSERVFVASICLVSVIYGALFESSLATVYIRPLYYKDINTMAELDSAGLRIYIKHAAMKDDLFYGHSSQFYRNLDHKLLMVAETEERLISMMSKRGGFAAVTRSSSLLLDDIRYFITNKIHKIPECPKNYHIAFVLPRHSPYEEAIDLHLLRFMEAGFIDQWIDESKHKAKTKIHTFPDYRAELGNQWKVLTLRDLQLSFYALGFGCVFAFLSLSFEICLRNKCNTLFSR